MRKSILFGALAFFAISALGIQNATAQNEDTRIKKSETSVAVEKKDKPALATDTQKSVEQKKVECCGKKGMNEKKAEGCENKKMDGTVERNCAKKTEENKGDCCASKKQESKDGGCCTEKKAVKEDTKAVKFDVKSKTGKEAKQPEVNKTEK